MALCGFLDVLGSYKTMFTHREITAVLDGNNVSCTLRIVFHFIVKVKPLSLTYPFVSQHRCSNGRTIINPSDDHPTFILYPSSLYLYMLKGCLNPI